MFITPSPASNAVRAEALCGGCRTAIAVHLALCTKADSTIDCVKPGCQVDKHTYLRSTICCAKARVMQELLWSALELNIQL
jgi:hypothetical protein